MGPDSCDGRPTAPSRGPVAGLSAAVLIAAVGVAVYLRSSAHVLHSPDHHLQQLDLLYLDQPAPHAEELGVHTGRVTLLLIGAAAARRPSMLMSSRPLMPRSHAATACSPRMAGWVPATRSSTCGATCATGPSIQDRATTPALPVDGRLRAAHRAALHPGTAHHDARGVRAGARRLGLRSHEPPDRRVPTGASVC